MPALPLEITGEGGNSCHQHLMNEGMLSHPIISLCLAIRTGGKQAEQKSSGKKQSELLSTTSHLCYQEPDQSTRISEAAASSQRCGVLREGWGVSGSLTRKGFLLKGATQQCTLWWRGQGGVFPVGDGAFVQIRMHALSSVGILSLSFITLKGNIFISWWFGWDTTLLNVKGDCNIKETTVK